MLLINFKKVTPEQRHEKHSKVKIPIKKAQVKYDGKTLVIYSPLSFRLFLNYLPQSKYSYCTPNVEH